MVTAHAIKVHECGGPDVLEYEEIDVTEPGPGQVLVRNDAVGLNFLDTYLRSGRYAAATPFVPGHEGAGVVERVGAGVTDIGVGDRVGYIDPMGAYADLVVRPVDRLIPLPPGISTRLAAGMLMKGMTSEYLVRRTYPVRRGQTILVHAAAGGVGQILCQWARYLGARVIGTVGSAAKRRIAVNAGCEHVIVNDEDDLVAAVRDITAGHGVPVVYDGVGGDSFAKSLDCLAPLGTLVAFGAASGPIPPLDVQTLGPKGSLYVTRPMIGPYVATTGELRSSAQALFELVLDGYIKVDIANSYPLTEAACAHADLEARKLTGSTVLVP
ncbi:quinone oxidoreductase [Mycobacterium sp. 21AC1]|uniref:quinone oxidoreductase family protein n=1 Tax=[Mycobacterium] appelbergii TaxID=2939269 RepID=UPI0029391703|nr:quinone oxidoreductase [Mycobacterium sp. 21AC1]MDV3123556.1 quinone oxidoreductase [Mycobacterium sp. 21AC1]